MSANVEEETFMIKLKKWWKSATVWLAGAMIAVENLSPVLPMMGIEMDPVIRKVVVTGIGLAMIYNRLFNTRQAVTEVAATKPVVADRTLVK